MAHIAVPKSSARLMAQTLPYRRIGVISNHIAASKQAAGSAVGAARTHCSIESKSLLGTGEDALRKMAREIFNAGCEAVNPYNAVSRAVEVDGNQLMLCKQKIELKNIKRIFLIAAGKASIGMAQGILDKLGPKISEGVVVTKHGHAKGHNLPSNIKLFEAGHPTPDKYSQIGTQSILDLARRVTEQDLVIVCISGGGSALLCAPRQGISLEEMQVVTRALLACGCSIDDKNAILKHLSQVKGGQLRKAIFPGKCASLVLSDVVGDPLHVIASGPTVPDTSTLEECRKILERYKLENQVIPSSCLEHILSSKAVETPKQEDNMFKDDLVEIIGSNQIATKACTEKAASMGFRTLDLGSHIEGDALAVGTVMAGILRSVQKHATPSPPPLAIICGGETTMTLPPNPGFGGRNQALALSAMKALAGVQKVALLSGGTDGGDGPKHDAAGAVITGSDFDFATQNGLDYAKALATADSYTFFKEFENARFGAKNVMHMRDGPTGTNVMDLIIMLAV